MGTVLSLREISLLVFQSMNTREFNRFEEIFSEEVVLDFPGIERIEGKRKVIVFLKTLLLRKYTKLIFTVSDVVIQDQKACAIWTNEGISNTGIPYSNTGMTLMHFSDNKITFISDYFKDTSFVKS
jgi:ketosteroid isomerase-like protein